MGEEKKGYVGSIRQSALRLEKLGGQERHGKRLDDTSAMRKVREASPLVYGTLDLKDALTLHMQDVQRSKGARTACVHAFVQYPSRLIDADTYDGQYTMLMHAVKFLNRFHGSDAVFAARLDRDERGQHGVDVFFMPRYEHRYKNGRVTTKASPSKFSKAEAKRRYGRDDVRSQGSALQDAWYEYLRDEVQLVGVEPPDRKKLSIKDRLEPEEYGLEQDRLRFNRERTRQQEELHRDREKISKIQIALSDMHSKLYRDAKIMKNLQIAAGRPISKALNDILEVKDNER